MILKYRTLPVGTFALFFFLYLSIHSNLTAATPRQSGSDTCFVSLDDGLTVYSSADSSVLQDTISIAPDGSTIKIAGECIGTQLNQGSNQTAYISKTVTLDGGYQTSDWLNPTTMSTLDAQESGRVLRITDGVTVTLNRLIIKNGRTTNQDGAGIYVSGTSSNPSTLFLDQTWVTDNQTLGFFGNGAGIHAVSTAVNIDTSIVAHNQAAQNGGGISALTSQTKLNVINSTIYSNTAARNGGGIFTSRVINLANSTISHNTANSAGAIYATTRLYISSSTIVSNTSASLGGVYARTTGNYIQNSILAHNTANGTIENCSGNTMNSYGYNIVDSVCPGLDAANNDLINTNPELQPLYQLESDTILYPPRLLSPAVDAGQAPICTAITDSFTPNPLFSTGDILDTDQQGFLRVDVDGDLSTICDIGALEYQKISACVIPDGEPINAQISISNTDVVITVFEIGEFQIGATQMPYDTPTVETHLAGSDYTDVDALLNQNNSYYRLSYANVCAGEEPDNSNWFGKFEFTLQPGS